MLALRIGKSDEVLRKKIADSPTHMLGAREALTLARLCVEAGSEHAYDYASVVALECGGRFERTPMPSDADLTPMQQVSGLMREAADVNTVIANALANNTVPGIVDINDNQMAAIDRELDQTHANLQLVRMTCRAIHSRGKRRIEVAPVRAVEAGRAALSA